MKKRNPLLYEDLVGKYLTQKEIEEQNKQCTGAENATLVDILLNQIERDQIKELRESQLEAEEEAREEVDTSDEDDEESVADNEAMESDNDSDCTQEETGERPEGRKHHLSSGEKSFWKGEFIRRMYDSFLEGKDVDFDYSKVDDNPDFDNVTDRAQDEEEKYFDSETPEMFVASAVNSDTEDELDGFMKNLKVPSSAPSDLPFQLNMK